MIEPSKSITAGGKTYSPREIHALLQKLASLGINRDKIIAQINPEEAALLKRLGGSGKINPRTGLLSFDDGYGDGGYGDDGGYGGGEYDGGGSYDGYGGGWEGGVGGTYGDFDSGAFADAVAANNEAMSGAIGDAMSYSSDADAPAFGAQEAKSESRVGGGGPSYGANVGPLQDAYDQMLANQAAINAGVFGGLPTEDYSAPSPTVGAMAGPGVSGAGLDALGGAGFGSFGLSGVQGGGAPFGGNAAPSSYDNMTMAQLHAAAQNLASQIEAINAGQQPDAASYSGPVFDIMGNVAMPGVGRAPEVELSPEISVTASAPSGVGGAPTFSGGAGSSLGPGQNYLSEEGQSVGPFTFSGPGTGGFAPVGTNLGSPFGGTIANGYFSSFGATPAGEYSGANWISSLGPEYQGPQATTPSTTPMDQPKQDATPPSTIGRGVNPAGGPPEGLTPQATTPSTTPMDWNAWLEQYNASQLLPFEFDYQPEQDAARSLTSGRGDIPAFGYREELTPRANIPSTPEEVSLVATEPNLSGSDIYYDSGGAEPGWVEPTGLVPEIIDEGALTPPPVPTATPTPTPTPSYYGRSVLWPIDWFRYGELAPEFSFYTPSAARGGYFDADAYFADGGLVSQPRAPVQPTVASMPTMAYTDGQGLVGSVAAPPGLTPYDAYGSDAQHASPMAPSPAAAVPAFGGPLQALAARNTNAAPVPAPIPQNPNLGYSLGLSGLRG